MAVHGGTRRTSYAVQLAKSGVRDRVAEDAVASRLLIRALAEAARVDGAADVDLGLEPGSGADGTEQLHVGVTIPVNPRTGLQNDHSVQLTFLSVNRHSASQRSPGLDTKRIKPQQSKLTGTIHSYHHLCVVNLRILSATTSAFLS